MKDNYMDSLPPILNVDDVAEVLGVTSNTVRKLVRNGDLACVKVGRLIRIPKKKLMMYLTLEGE